MHTFLESQTFVVAFTFMVYFLAQKLQQKTKMIILNPILVSIVIIILFLSVFNIKYESYHEGSKLIEL